MPPDRYRVLNETRGSVVASEVTLAATSNSRRRGLLGLDAMPEGFGLWIVPTVAIHTFSMRFAIDVLFLDRHQRVLKVNVALKPWRIAACLRAHSVLELAAGAAARSSLQIGDQLRFQT